MATEKEKAKKIWEVNIQERTLLNFNSIQKLAEDLKYG